MDRQSFEAEVLAGLGGRISSEEAIQLTVDGSSYNLVHKWIDRAMRRVARKRSFEALRDEDTSLATVADDDTPIDLSSYTKSVVGVRIIDGTSSRLLVYRPPSWFDRWHPNPGSNSSGKPQYYTIKDAALRFIPVPNDDYTLYVDRMKWPANLSADDSEPDFGTDLVDDIIIEYAIGYGFTKFGEVYKKDAVFHFQLGDALLLEAFVVDDYVPAYEPTPDGYMMEGARGAWNAYDSGSFPSGTTRPFYNR